MALVWADGRCPVCKNPIYDSAVLVADVEVTAYEARDVSRDKAGQHSVRPIFRRGEKTRTMYHRNCYLKILIKEGT